MILNISINLQDPIVKEGKQQKAEGPIVHRIRIVLTSHNVKSLEKVCVDLICGAKKQKLRVKVSFVEMMI